MDRFQAMRTLTAAVDGGSLSAAARTLNLPLPTVSRRVSDLEAMLGSQLLVRTSRRLLLTEAGTAYVAAVRPLLDQLAEAERMAAGEYRTPRGELLVTAPIQLGGLHVAPLVHDFLAAYPEVAVRLALLDTTVDLVESHVDVAVRFGTLPDSQLIARRVGAIGFVVCASPDYLARRGLPAHPADLTDHDCIAFEGLQRYRDWHFAGADGPTTVTIRPRFSVNTADAVVAGGVAGLGLIRVMAYQAADAVAAGRLVPVLGDWAPPPVPLQLVHAPAPLLPLKLRAFLDFAAPRLAEVCRQVAETFA